MFQRVIVGFALSAVVAVWPAVGAAQQTASSREALLAQGWSELAAGRGAAAAAVATRLLKAAPRDHDAASLSVAALLASSGHLPALDSYEAWLAASRREDVFLLEEIAIGVLRTLAGSTEPRISFAALAALAEQGDASARSRLATLSRESSLPVEADVALAQMGDAAGLQRLRERITSGGPRDKTRAIDALKRSGQPGVAVTIAEALKDPAPPSRIAAANALAELGATEALPQLRAAVNDPDPSVRTVVEIALGLLGDPLGQAAVARLATSPLPEFRLMAARQAAAQDPKGAWAATVEDMLADPDPIVRLEAAKLLMSHGRSERAEQVLAAALNDPSAPLRSLAAEAAAALPLQQQSLPVIRRMLRDSAADVRLQAALTLFSFK